MQPVVRPAIQDAPLRGARVTRDGADGEDGWDNVPEGDAVRRRTLKAADEPLRSVLASLANDLEAIIVKMAYGVPGSVADDTLWQLGGGGGGGGGDERSRPVMMTSLTSASAGLCHGSEK